MCIQASLNKSIFSTCIFPSHCSEMLSPNPAELMVITQEGKKKKLLLLLLSLSWLTVAIFCTQQKHKHHASDQLQAVVTMGITMQVRYKEFSEARGNLRDRTSCQTVNGRAQWSPHGFTRTGTTQLVAVFTLRGKILKERVIIRQSELQADIL